jgi:hypothetical protein
MAALKAGRKYQEDLNEKAIPAPSNPAALNRLAGGPDNAQQFQPDAATINQQPIQPHGYLTITVISGAKHSPGRITNFLQRLLDRGMSGGFSGQLHAD